MELDKISGLPAHPLLVHIPIVLIPLASIALVLIAVSTSAHLRLRWYVLGLAAVATLGTLFAAGSGEELERDVERSAVLREHTELGDQMRPVAVLLLLAVIAVIAVTHFAGRRTDTNASVGAAVSSRRAMNPVLRAVVIVGAVGVATLNTVWIIRTGHEGAKATWSEESEEGQERASVGDRGQQEDEEHEGSLAPLDGSSAAGS